MLRLLLDLAAVAAAATAAAAPEDPYRWLEDVDGERAMAWVHAQNQRTAEHLAEDAAFEALYQQALSVLNSASRIPSVTRKGDRLYNLWKDADHPRGVYRRTTLKQLRSDDPAWETVLDIDALAEAEDRPWVFHGMDCLPPAHRRCLVALSPGGGDADVVREFDAEAKQFVADGFEVPLAKTSVAWRDADSLYVASDFGPGSLTESGYPRTVRLWSRGKPLAEASEIHAGSSDSVRVGAARIRTDEGAIDLVVESLTFWENRYYQHLDGKLHTLVLPESAVVEGGIDGKLIVSLKAPWRLAKTEYAAGTVLVADPAMLRGGEGELSVLVEPAPSMVVEAVDALDDSVLVTALDNVRGRVYRYSPGAEGWVRTPVAFPDNGAIEVITTDGDSGSFFATFEGFTTPTRLYHVAGPGAAPEVVKAQAESFDGERFRVTQHFARSADGTEVPYFLVIAEDAELDGRNPTHIFSYGGFRVALTPSYSGSYEPHSGAYGKLWLERGGAFVLANIRGGGEFGPAWHEAALLENRHKAFEDFEAVARDLVDRGVTSPAHLGIEGRSNGGLLVGAAITRAPSLYGAAVIGVPLLDMRRYHELLAGASWMAEYGDPDDPAQWDYLRTYSPYHNLDAEADYPPVFFYTSTRDDRVHPGHARKMAARMLELGEEVWYYENTEGGHGGSVTNEQLAYRIALSYAHLWKQLKP